MCETIATRAGERDRRLHLRRRHAAGRAARDPRRARTSCSAIPTCCTRASCRTIRAGRSCSRTCATSSSTSCTRIAACSAATCATCCGGCSASAGTTARIRCSSARRRRSPIRASWPSGSTEQPFELVEQERRAARREVLRLRQPAGRQPAARHPALVSERDAPRRVRVPQAQPAADRLRAEPARDRDPDDVSEGRLRGRAGRARARSAAIAAATCRTGGARSRRGCARARCAPSSRPTRSSSASTSARSTCRVMAGYPGTIAATWQRAGRAGRRASRSAAVMVASSAPLDQFVVRNPSYFFDASPEHALIDPDNLHILVDHVKCAAFELPFTARRARSAGTTCRRCSACWRAGPGASLAARRRHAATGSGTGRTSRIRPTRSACGRCRRTTSSIVDTTRRARASSARPTSRAGRRRCTRRRSTSSKGSCSRSSGSTSRAARRSSRADRLRLLHRRDHLHEGDDPRHVRERGRSGSRTATAVRDRARLALARRSPRRLARRRLQEDQVLHQRERRLRRARSARAADAHDVVLADDSGGGDGGAAVRGRRSARRRRRAGVRDAAGRAAAADVRSATTSASRSTAATSVGDGGDGVPEPATSRRSSSTTTILAASASASRCSGCTTSCSTRTRRLIAECAVRERLSRLRRSRSATPVRSRRRRRCGSSICCSQRRDRGWRRRGDALRERSAACGCAVIRPAIARRSSAPRRRCRRAPGPARDSRAIRIADRLAATLGGDVARPTCFVVERRYDAGRRAHGRATVGVRRRSAAAGGSSTRRCSPAARRRGRRSCSSISRPPARAAAPARYAFLVGCGWFDDDGAFVTRQFLLTSYADERALLAAVAAELARAGALVSFNGKSFDAPVIETRYLFHRLRWPARTLPHVDVLHPARRFWRRRAVEAMASCSLVRARAAVLGARRVGDVPGFEIPGALLPVRPQRRRAAARRRCSSTTGSICCRSPALTARLLRPGATRPGTRRATRARRSRSGTSTRARGARRRAARDALRGAPSSDASAARRTLRQVDALRALALACAARGGSRRRPRCWRAAARRCRACPRAVAREATEALAIHHEHRVRDLAAAKRLRCRALERSAPQRDADGIGWRGSSGRWRTTQRSAASSCAARSVKIEP